MATKQRLTNPVNELRRAKEHGVAVIVCVKGGGLWGPNGTYGVGTITKTGVTLIGDKGTEARIPLAMIEKVIPFQTAPIRKNRRMA